jgi:probable H4MPT-linked C1 transfer pathway protein
MAKVLGWDIGGANIKAVYLQTSNGTVKKTITLSEYFPLWKNPKKLSPTLKRLHGKLTPTNLDAVAVTMTAELSDAYRNKREGVNHVLDCLEKIFHKVPLYIVDVGGALISPSKARRQPLRVASANWAASGWLASQLFDNCILMDVGSTTTTIIPIVDGQVVAEGLTDLGKLSNGELVYTGALRTNIATVVDFIPLRGRRVRVSSELFATTADVHLLLNNITADRYTVETADGRGKTKSEAASRIARVICADTNMLTAGEIKEIAAYVAKQQVNQIAEAFREVLNRCRRRGKVTEKIIVTGVGKNFLARRAVESCGCKEIIDFSKLVSPEASKVTPAIATALMAANTIEKVTLKRWLTP